MNFMAKSSSQGFFGEDQNQNNNNQMMMMSNSSGRGMLPFSSTSSASSSSSSSSPSSQLHKVLVPLNFHQYQNQHQLGASRLEPRQTPPEDIRCYAGEFARPDLMEASPAALNNGHHEAVAAASTEDYNDVNREDSSPDGLGLGLGGGGGGSATGSGVGMVVEREHMFDKVVTPSDVGKLNRLVIPKQHAEKYFPLDSSTNEKGLLLNFEDRNGKPWRFRYSYWNSSQSYVMTKGWSRFVKEKKLDAGDIVSFQRGVGEMGKDRLYIDWRRRPDAPDLPPSYPTLSHLPHPYFSFHRSTHSHPWTSPGPPLFLQHQASRNNSHIQQYTNAANYQPHSSSYGYNYFGGNSGPYGYNNTPSSSSVIYVRSGGGGSAPRQAAAGMVQLQSGGRSSGGGVEPNPMVFESVPVVHGKAAAKRLRLFGVNMDCPITESDECDVLSSTTVSQSLPPANTMAPHPPLQLRLYNGSPPIQADLLDKGKASSSREINKTGEEM